MVRYLPSENQMAPNNVHGHQKVIRSSRAGVETAQILQTHFCRTLKLDKCQWKRAAD